MHSGVFTNINIEHTDNYGITGITGISGGHANAQMTAAYGTAYGYSQMIAAVATSYTGTEGDGGSMIVDQNTDFFIVSAEM